jgi:uncharacterized membrane protein (DUF485 family)
MSTIKPNVSDYLAKQKNRIDNKISIIKSNPKTWGWILLTISFAIILICIFLLLISFIPSANINRKSVAYGMTAGVVLMVISMGVTAFNLA